MIRIGTLIRQILAQSVEMHRIRNQLRAVTGWTEAEADIWLKRVFKIAEASRIANGSQCAVVFTRALMAQNDPEEALGAVRTFAGV